MAIALVWVSRITTISIQMVLPGVVGYWIDQQLRTKALFTLLGFGLGMGIGMWQLILATRTDENHSNNGEFPDDGER